GQQRQNLPTRAAGYCRPRDRGEGGRGEGQEVSVVQGLDDEPLPLEYLGTVHGDHGLADKREEDAVGLTRVDALDVPERCLAAGPRVGDEHHRREAAQREGAAAPSAPAAGAPPKGGHPPWHPPPPPGEGVWERRGGGAP